MADEEPTGTMVAEGFEPAFLGYAWSAHRPPIAIYDRKRAQRVLMDRAGMTADEADEFIQYKVESDWKGPGTPLFLTRCTFDDFIDWSNAE